MVLTPDQVQGIIKSLGPKITESCPTCGLSNRRQIAQELFVFTSYTPKSPAAPFTPGGGSPYHSTLDAALQALATPAPTKVPCIMLMCNNCGFTEFYNVHVLGLAVALGLPPAGAPIP